MQIPRSRMSSKSSSITPWWVYLWLQLAAGLPQQKYTLHGVMLELLEDIRDLGICMDSKLKLHTHTDFTANKAHMKPAIELFCQHKVISGHTDLSHTEENFLRVKISTFKASIIILLVSCHPVEQNVMQAGGHY